MSYIITAEVRLSDEENFHGDRSKVDARVLSERDGYITFDVAGDHYKKEELTKKLCSTLIDAGFLSFDIGHSY